MSYTSGKFSKQAQKVLKDDIDGIPKNNRLAYESKAREFLGFFKCVYGNMGTWDHITFALLQRRNFLHFYFIKHIEMKEREDEKKHEFRMKTFLILMIITR